MDDKIWEYMEKLVTPFNEYQINRFSSTPYWSIIKHLDDLTLEIGSGNELMSAVEMAMKEESTEDDDE